MGPMMRLYTQVNGKWVRADIELDPEEISCRFAHSKIKKLRAAAAVMTIAEVKEVGAHVV